MTLAWLAVLGGLVLLVAGGEALVRGASGIALLARVSPAVIGLTVVAAGTSFPELVVSVNASLRDSPGLAVGNVVGSNVFNATAILGLAALLRPLRIQGSAVRFEWPVAMLSACALHALARDLEVDRIEGCLLLGAMVAFTAWMVRAARRDAGLIDAMEVAPVPGLPPSAHGARAWLGNLGAVALGLGLLVGGSSLLVHGAVAIAEGLGVSDTVIGLSVVAAGTSLPELAASVVASLRGKDDMAVANVLGSNIFNSLAIIGTSSLVRPLTVPERVIRSDDWWMLGATALLLPVMRSGMRIGRLEGALLVACFISYMVWLVRGA